MRKRDEVNTDTEESNNTKKRKKKSEKKMSPLQEAVMWVVYLIAVIIVSTLIVDFIAQRTGVQGSSMATTLEDGDNVLVEKLSYRFGDRSAMILSCFRQLTRRMPAHIISNVL